MTNTAEVKEKKGFKIPSPLVLLVCFILLAVLASYFIPAGEFSRIEDPATGQQIVDANSFHGVEQNPTSFFDAFKSVPTGMGQAGYIIFFMLIIGGTFQIMQATGAIEVGMATIVKKMAGKETLLIPVVMFVFSLGGAFIGNAEEVLAFIPLMVTMCLALGFDSITGTAILLVGSCAGFSSGMTNAFTVGVAQGISGLPLFSGIELRACIYVVMVTVSILYVYRYAKKVKANPLVSSMYELDKTLNLGSDTDHVKVFTVRHKLVLLTFASGIAFLVFGVVKLGFYIDELSALFLIIGVVAGIVGGLSADQMGDEFIKGAGSMLFAGIIIGFSKAITVILTDAKVLDTIIFSLGSLLKGLPPMFSALGMLLVQMFTNVVVPSGSGQAAVTMPLMAPLAELIGVTKQTAVLAFQFGDSFSNILTPTSGWFMAAIAMSNISWSKWAKWFFPLFLIWVGIAAVFMIIAVQIGYGPF